jgi:hypothetical protein
MPMPESSDQPWVPWLLFRLTVGLAVALLLAVVLAPWIDEGAPHPHGWPRLLALFARDAVVRRTAIGAGVGLLGTAFVCFRQPGTSRGSSRPNPPRPIAGA